MWALAAGGITRRTPAGPVGVRGDEADAVAAGEPELCVGDTEVGVTMAGGWATVDWPVQLDRVSDSSTALTPNTFWRSTPIPRTLPIHSPGQNPS